MSTHGRFPEPATPASTSSSTIDLHSSHFSVISSKPFLSTIMSATQSLPLPKRAPPQGPSSAAALSGPWDRPERSTSFSRFAKHHSNPVLSKRWYRQRDVFSSPTNRPWHISPYRSRQSPRYLCSLRRASSLRCDRPHIRLRPRPGQRNPR